MQDVGLSPVFFSQTLVGSQMPNLVYMVSGENMDEHKKHWEGFFERARLEKVKRRPAIQRQRLPRHQHLSQAHARLPDLTTCAAAGRSATVTTSDFIWQAAVILAFGAAGPPCAARG
jgi:hypothetical protein